jgi:hypothetical protein
MSSTIDATVAKHVKRSSVEVERGSIVSTNSPQTKPRSRGHDDPAYSVKRWLKQRPHEKPCCGSMVPVTQVSGHGEFMTKLVIMQVIYLLEFAAQRHGAEKRG